MNHNRFFVFLLVAVFLPFSSVTISGNLNDFEAVRYPDANETFLTDMSYSLSFTVSTDSRVLTSNAEAANLPNEAFVCPGNIRATFSPSLSFARRYLTSVAPLPERCNLPLQYQSQQSGTAQLNNALFETLNSTPYHRLEQDNLGTRTIYTGLANAVLSDSQRNIYYSQRFDEPTSPGAGNAGVLCTGTATIIKDNNERFSFDFPTHPSALFQNLQARSEPYTLGAYVSILDCHGIIAPKCRSQNGQIVDPLQIQKFIYYTDSDAYRLSTERASLRIYVRNPSVAASARIVQINNQPPPQILVIDRGQRIPIEIEISNSQSSEPRKVRITSIATNNNAVSISMDGVPTAWIDVGRSSIFTATLTANAEYTGQIAIVVSLEADGIVCDGSIPRPRLSIPLSVQIIRPLPDLEVEHVSRQPSTPNIGDNITFSVTIKNSGRGRADSSSACLVITTPNGQRLEPLIQNVGPLEENQTTSVRFAYAVQGPQGRTQYSIKADCLNQISESDESNNEISGTFYVLGREQRMPNIRAEDLRLLQEPLVGSEIQMAALIKNHRGEVSEFDTCLLITSPSGRAMRYSQNLPHLESDEERELRFNSIPINELGTYTAEVYADCNNDISEENEDDNRVERQFNSRLSDRLPNLQASLSVSQRGFICSGDTERILLRIVNNGTQNIENGSGFSNRLVIIEPDDSISFRDFRVQGGLQQRASTNFSLFYRFSQPGPYTIIGIADNEETIYESDENDNVASISSEVSRNLPNIRLQSISYEPERNILLDSTFLVNVFVENNGCADIPERTNITLSVIIQNQRHGNTLEQKISYLGGLRRNQTYEFQEIPFTLTQSFSGMNTITAIADEQNTIRELNESDNRLDTYFFAGGGARRGPTCIILSPSPPLYLSGQYHDVFVQYLNYVPNGPVYFDCGNGQQRIALTCQEVDTDAFCIAQSACRYETEGVYTARAIGPPSAPICQRTIEVELDEFSICNAYI